MKSNRVKYRREAESEKSSPDTELFAILLEAVAERAMLDYKRTTKKLAVGKYTSMARALDDIDEYFCIREYFDRGLNGAVETGKFPLSSQVDAHMCANGFDCESAYHNANKLLNSYEKEAVDNWLKKKLNKLYGENSNGYRKHTGERADNDGSSDE